jgi:pyroglutamyl-peptidase
VTRLYPVDFAEVRRRLEEDLAQGFDAALHLGQAPGSTCLRLEAIAVNVQGVPDQPVFESDVLEAKGPVAYRSNLPLADWSAALCREGLPCQVSHHAGVYLCNATLYWSRYLCELHGWKTRATFVHLPLETSQVVAIPEEAWASLPASVAASALKFLLRWLDSPSA